MIILWLIVKNVLYSAKKIIVYLQLCVKSERKCYQEEHFSHFRNLVCSTCSSGIEVIRDKRCVVFTRGNWERDLKDYKDFVKVWACKKRWHHK